jgi:regulator of replication initiation timing
VGEGAGGNMSETELAQETEVTQGRYVYCIASCQDELSLGNIGIENAEVYMVSHKDIAAVVHACQAQPYESRNENEVKEWILSHNTVIDKASERFGTVLPFSFDAVVKGDDDAIKDWLSKGYEKLKQELERLRDKAEYTMQIFCDQNKLMDKIIGENQSLRELKAKIEKMPKRAAYLLQRKFELQVKDAYNVLRGKLTEEFASKIKEHVEEVKAEKKVSQLPKNYKDKKLIAAFSCLVHKEKVKRLGSVLGEINSQEGYAVRFTGPWAPFSFVKLEDI